MKPTNRIYVGGPLLDPPDEPDDECESPTMTEAEKQQQAFDDVDPEA